MLIVIAPSLPLFLSLSFSKDCSRKDNCSLLKLSYCASCGCNSFCSVSVRENVRAANLEYAIASFLKWVQLTQLRFVQRLRTHTHTHPHTQREREGEACQVGCRELSEQQLPEMSVWAKWQPAGAANVARAFELNENVVNGSIQFTFAIKLTPNRHFWFSLCISDFTPCPPSSSLLPRGNLAGHDMTYNASD